MFIRLKDYNDNITEYNFDIDPSWIFVLLVISGDEVLHLYSKEGEFIATLDSNEDRLVDYFDSIKVLSFNDLVNLNK